MASISEPVTNLDEFGNEQGGKQKAVSPARLAAFEILQRVEQGAYASVLLASKEEVLKLADRALCHELVMGTLRWQLWLDRLIEHYSNRDPAKLDLGVRLALRLGLYQLRFLSRIPPSAAVNESVSLVRYARLRSAEGFVNAVLRRATRETEYDPTDPISDPIERIAVATSHPLALVERWVRAFGFEHTKAFAIANNQPAPLAFRVSKKGNKTKVIERLQAAGATFQPSAIAPGSWRISGDVNLARDSSRAGEIYFQDESSQLVAQALEAQTGERVLDLCAAPGSKTTQIAASVDGLSIIAGDIHEHRLRTVVEFSNRQELANIHCIALDGLKRLPFPEDTFDRVLVDAPCSGTGTLRRNPEIRWRITTQDIADLSTRQKQLIRNASQVVKPGGRLVYSTCSVEPEENEAVIRDFLSGNDEFVQVELRLEASVIEPSGVARTWPHRDGSDGFFVAGFERRS
jgi:16S rRNA (cytosine967-C5)-methyltransferase